MPGMPKQLVITARQFEMLVSAETALARARDHQQLVVHGIFAAAGLDIPEGPIHAEQRGKQCVLLYQSEKPKPGGKGAQALAATGDS